MVRMSDTRQGPQVAYPASARGELAYAANGEPASAASGEPAYAVAGRLQTADRPGGSRPGSDAGRVLRVLALIAVAVGLTALTAAACVLSYSSVHHLATQAGVHGRLARIYPLIFDAVLVVAGCSVLGLRGAGLVSRLYSWLCMLVLLWAGRRARSYSRGNERELLLQRVVFLYIVRVLAPARHGLVDDARR